MAGKVKIVPVTKGVKQQQDEDKATNAKIRVWAKPVVQILKAQSKSQLTKGRPRTPAEKTSRKDTSKRAGTTFRAKFTIRDGRTTEIAFTFDHARQVVFAHYGVGRGYKRVGGTTVRTAKGEITGMRRVAKPFFNNTVEKSVEELATILQESGADRIIEEMNFRRIGKSI